jgi:hypothetical protein
MSAPGWLLGSDGAAERRAQRQRDAIALVVAVALYVLPLAWQGISPAADPGGHQLGNVSWPSRVVERLLRGADASGRSRLQQALRDSLARGELSHGAVLIRLNRLAAGVESGRSLDVARAERIYGALLAGVKERILRGSGVIQAITAASEAEGYRRYKRIHDGLGDALLNGGGSCQAQSQLVAALMLDLGRGDDVFLRVFDNHVAPAIVERAGGRERERNFGMLGRCRGPGERVRATDLVGLYDLDHATRPREASRGPFRWPESRDSCDDTRADFGNRPLEETDPPRKKQRVAAAGDAEDGVIELRPGVCGEPIPPWRTDSLVSLVGDSVQASDEVFAVTYVKTDDWSVRHQSDRALCQQQLVAAWGGEPPPPLEQAVEFATLVGLYEEAALTFAAAGHPDFVEDYEQRRTRALRQGRAVLKSIDLSVEPDDHSLYERAWVLALLGPEGQKLLERMSARSPAALLGLLFDPATRPRALEIAEHYAPLEQVRLFRDLPPDAWQAELITMSPSGRRWLAVRVALEAVKTRWKKCRFDTLLAIVKEETERRGLEPRWVGPLFQHDFVLAYGTRCNAEEMGAFTRDYASWAARVGREEMRTLGFAP